MSHRIIYFLLLLLFIINGCAIISNYEGLKVLKQLNKNQQEIDSYIKEQEKGFNALILDIKNNRLAAGLSKEKIIAKYGAPVNIREIYNDSQIKEVLLYRHPTSYFSSDRVYLYFLKTGCLSNWEYEPHN